MTVDESKVEDLARIVEADPDDIDSRRLLVTALLDAGRNDEAERHFQFLARRFDDQLWLARLETELADALGDQLRLARSQRRFSRLIQYEDADDRPGHPSVSNSRSIDLQVIDGDHRQDFGRRGKLDDIVGNAAARARISEILDSVQTREPDNRWWGGTLLYGPDGCGKSFCAQILASELGADYVAMDLGAEWNRRSAKRLVNTLSSDNESARTVVFLDNLDQAQAADMVTLEPLILALDRAQSCRRVVVIGAASYPWEVLSDLLVPQRLGHLVFVPPPTPAARHKYLLATMTPPVDQQLVSATVRTTDGYSFSELAAKLGLSAPPPSEVDSKAWSEHARRHLANSKASESLQPLIDYLSLETETLPRSHQ